MGQYEDFTLSAFASGPGMTLAAISTWKASTVHPVCIPSLSVVLFVNMSNFLFCRLASQVALLRPP